MAWTWLEWRYDIAFLREQVLMLHADPDRHSAADNDLFWPAYPERGAMLPFALKVYLFTDGLFIIDAYDPGLIGARIDYFGKTPAAAAYEIVANAFPGDNDMEVRWVGARHLTQAYTLEALTSEYLGSQPSSLTTHTDI